MIWVPPFYGPDTLFHKAMTATHVKADVLAKAQSTEKVFIGIAIGDAQYHKLYEGGQCMRCEEWLTHVDGCKNICVGVHYSPQPLIVKMFKRCLI